ncbi:hypothetical protein OPKNFCMD_2761 [Methylobacterium crusticola]|uniref:Recombinase domain-containing protein n=1 Tax=Methylobacterium crusticola TaxID=1697972 RepID=A0ABQ4QXB0_9HYPH|nr:resolvase [Methylobacterium crusticola]GJD50025.1 hypothetical protein OPKNFCMD_2761 [Methylobacterium crusticola]
MDPVPIVTAPWNGGAVMRAKADSRAADLAPVLAEIRAGGARSLREIAAGLNGRCIPTAFGGKWSAVQVRRVLARLEA